MEGDKGVIAVHIDLTTFLLAFIAFVLLAGVILLGVVAFVIWRKKIPVKGAAALIAAVLYFISPVDVVPEVAFGPFGLLDDAGVLAAAFMYASHVLRARRAGLPLGSAIGAAELRRRTRPPVGR
jgi:uncharacterized membrane protein YkvA (DUF1232 family)